MATALRHDSQELAPRRRSLPASGSTRLLVVDDHPAVRRGLRELLDDHVDFTVVASVASAEEAIVLAEQAPVDVAIVDYRLGGRNGLWLSRKLAHLPNPPRVVIYSAYADGLLAAAAVVAEADGVVGKGGLGSELCEAVRAVAAGYTAVPAIPWPLREMIRCRLDDEEQAIYGMRLAGIDASEVAQTLGLSLAELQSRLSSMLRKLEAPGIVDRHPAPLRGAFDDYRDTQG